VKRLRIAILICLLLVPALLHGHRHDTLRSSAAPCAACVAAHHSPALRAPAVVVSAPLVSGRMIYARPVSALAKGERPPRTGRAPPFPLQAFDA
jgi:hypothetical protein